MISPCIVLLWKTDWIFRMQLAMVSSSSRAGRMTVTSGTPCELPAGSMQIHSPVFVLIMQIRCPGAQVASLVYESRSGGIPSGTRGSVQPEYLILRTRIYSFRCMHEGRHLPRL